MTVAQPDTIVAWGRTFAERPVGRPRIDRAIAKAIQSCSAQGRVMALPDGISNGAMMSSKMVSVEEAEARLLELIGLAEQGEDIVITHQDQPKVKLVPIAQVGHKRIFGQHRGKIRMRPDFDDQLPDDFWLSGTP